MSGHKYRKIPWPISVTHAIITTGHPIFTICHNIINQFMSLSIQFGAIINKIYTIIIYPMLLLTI